MLSVAESRADSSWERTTRDFESPLELLLVATACSFPTRLLQTPRPPIVDVTLPLSELLDQPIDATRIVRAHPAECSFVLLGKNPPAQHQIVVSLVEHRQLGAQALIVASQSEWSTTRSGATKVGGIGTAATTRASIDMRSSSSRLRVPLDRRVAR